MMGLSIPSTYTKMTVAAAFVSILLSGMENYENAPYGLPLVDILPLHYTFLYSISNP